MLGDNFKQIYKNLDHAQALEKLGKYIMQS